MEKTDKESRNIIDFYAYWKEEAIRADMREKCHNFSVLALNTIHDFNLGSLIRNANAFCAKEVIIYGDKKFDRRGAVGTHHYIDMRHVKLTETLDLSGKVVVGIDNVAGAVPLETFQWPSEHVVMVFGEEGTGIIEDMLTMCKHVVYIKQYGTVRSLNIGAASAIAMYDYCQKHSNRD